MAEIDLRRLPPPASSPLISPTPRQGSQAIGALSNVLSSATRLADHLERRRTQEEREMEDRQAAEDLLGAQTAHGDILRTYQDAIARARTTDEIKQAQQEAKRAAMGYGATRTANGQPALRNQLSRDRYHELATRVSIRVDDVAAQATRTVETAQRDANLNRMAKHALDTASGNLAEGEAQIQQTVALGRALGRWTPEEAENEAQRLIADARSTWTTTQLGSAEIDRNPELVADVRKASQEWGLSKADRLSLDRQLAATTASIEKAVEMDAVNGQNELIADYNNYLKSGNLSMAEDTLNALEDQYSTGPRALSAAWFESARAGYYDTEKAKLAKIDTQEQQNALREFDAKVIEQDAEGAERVLQSIGDLPPDTAARMKANIAAIRKGESSQAIKASLESFEVAMMDRDPQGAAAVLREARESTAITPLQAKQMEVRLGELQREVRYEAGDEALFELRRRIASNEISAVQAQEVASRLFRDLRPGTKADDILKRASEPERVFLEVVASLRKESPARFGGRIFDTTGKDITDDLDQRLENLSTVDPDNREAIQSSFDRRNSYYRDLVNLSANSTGRRMVEEFMQSKLTGAALESEIRRRVALHVQNARDTELRNIVLRREKQTSPVKVKDYLKAMNNLAE